MKKLLFLLSFLSLLACTPEKLKMHTQLSTSGYNFNRGMKIDLKVEHNGDGLIVKSGTKVISNNGIFTIPADAKYGTNHFIITTYRNEDSLSYPVECFVVPSEKSTTIAYEVVNTYPHPSELFTQGFTLSGDLIIESSGQYGQSALSTYKLGSRKILQQHKLPESWFAEGMTLLDDTIYQVTWREGKCMKYTWNGSEFTPVKEHDFKIREGWGLSAYNHQLVWTDGTQNIRFVDPFSLTTVSTKESMNSDGYFGNLNETEIYKGYLAANIWQSDRIVFIDLESGASTRHLDLTEIAIQHDDQGTLNGIAVRGENLLITGKNWDVIYELKLDWK